VEERRPGPAQARAHAQVVQAPAASVPRGIRASRTSGHRDGPPERVGVQARRRASGGPFFFRWTPGGAPSFPNRSPPGRSRS
jgi:hypothetical protein